MSGAEVDVRVGIDAAEALAIAARLGPTLPPALRPVFDASFIRSHALYEAFVRRLALRVLREAGLEGPVCAEGTVEDIAARAGLDAGRVAVPLGWILRHLARWGVLEAGAARLRFHARSPLPRLDSAGVVRERGSSRQVACINPLKTSCPGARLRQFASACP